MENIVDSQSESGSDNLADLLSAKRMTTADVVKYFDMRGDAVDVSCRNKDGLTPLMIACSNGMIGVMTYLLEKGADPNSTSKDGNTALHYATQYVKENCEHADFTAKETSEGKQNELDSTEQTTQKTSKVQVGKTSGENKKDVAARGDSKSTRDPDPQDRDGEGARKSVDATIQTMLTTLVVDYHASFQENKSGLSPADLGALTGNKNTVYFFVRQNFCSQSALIKALELLAVHFLQKGKIQLGCETLKVAMKTRYANPNNPIIKEDAPTMQKCIGRKECQSMDDYKKLASSGRYKCKTEALLIGDRVLPAELKSEYVYTWAARYGCKLFFNRKTADTGFELLKGCFSLEEEGLLRPGYILAELQEVMSKTTGFLMVQQVMEPFLNQLCALLESYVGVVKKAPLDLLTKHVRDIMSDLALILYRVTEEFLSVKVTEDFLEPVKKIITTTWDRIPKPAPSAKGDSCPSVSVCHNVIMILVHSIFSCSRELTPYTCFKRLVAQLLHIEGAQDINYRGKTMLHTLMPLTSSRQRYAVQALVELLLRHGCPTDVRNEDGKTALQILEYECDIDPEYLEDAEDTEMELYNLLKGHTQVYSLQELAARAILRHGIPYTRFLPEQLWIPIKDPILMQDEEESEYSDSTHYSDSSLEDFMHYYDDV